MMQKIKKYLKNNLLALAILSCTAPLAASWAEETLSNMNLRQKIGQLFIARTVSDFNQPTPFLRQLFEEMGHTARHEHIIQLIKEYHIGGIIFLLDSDIKKHVESTNKFQSESTLPLLNCLDAENGLSLRLKNGIPFPWNMTLGALQDEDLIFEMGTEVARELREVGVHMAFGPVYDTNNNPGNPVIAYRSFGENPHDVARKATLFMQGMQEGGILTCAKHWPGHGDVTVDSHYGTPIITHDRNHLHEVEILPFKKAIDAGVDAIMTAHIMVPAYDEHRIATLSYPIVTELLKNELGFQGVIITDGLEMKGASEHFAPGQLELEAFLAGNDMLLCSVDIPKAIECIENAIQDSPALQKDLDERVLKILKFKERLNLHTQNLLVDSEKALAAVITPQALALKKKLFSQAITVLKNDNNTLPISDKKTGSMVMISQGACTFSEKLQQGLPHFNALYVEESDAYKTIEESVKDNDTFIFGVFGITKHIKNHYGIPPELLSLIERLKDQGKKVIVTLFGYPYSAGLFGNEDALIMAYEDDSDAQEAAAQIILGSLQAKGKLPISANERYPRGSGF